MNKYIFVLFIGIIPHISLSQSKGQLRGNVVDGKTQTALVGATIYFPDLKKGTLTDIQGKYELSDLPLTDLMMEVSLVGFKTIIKQVNPAQNHLFNIQLEEAVTELGELVVTGLSKAEKRSRTPLAITAISTLQLKQSSATNIIDAITSEPGISQITTGSGISKPIIRGLGGNRVVVVSDGIRQEGQQWGEEHGIEIDEYSVNRVEILKGPASLAFGSDALAGVINLISAPTISDGSIRGGFFSNFQTNQGLIGHSFNLAGNKKGLIWDTRFSHKMAHAYKNRLDGYVLNSGFRENSQSTLLGVNKSWGYSHLQLSRYEITPGLIEGERDESGEFVKFFTNNDGYETTTTAEPKDFISYSPLVPYQNIQHLKAVQSNLLLLKNGTLKTTLGLQNNRRKEFTDIQYPNQYGLYLRLNTINYDINYSMTHRNNIEYSTGISGMVQRSKNYGSEYLIPDYGLFDIGAFVLTKMNWQKTTLSAGVRYDVRNEKGLEMWNEEELQFSSFNRIFSGISGSLGSTYRFNNDIFLKLNISKGYRAPNIAELSANGVHEGSVNYIIGQAKLRPENSLQLDLGVGVHTDHFTTEVQAFVNKISHYIYLEKMKHPSGQDILTQGYPTFKYTAGNAYLYGGEMSLDIHPHPLDWLHFENSISLVYAQQLHQTDSTRYLPYIPAPKFQSEIKADLKIKPLKNTYLKLVIEHFSQQNRVYWAYDTETATPAYTLINFGVGSEFTYKRKSIFSLMLNVNNLLDVTYQSHLSRLKYLPLNEKTNQLGVFNMGRNVSVKLIIPFEFKI